MNEEILIGLGEVSGKTKGCPGPAFESAGVFDKKLPDPCKDPVE